MADFNFEVAKLHNICSIKFHSNTVLCLLRNLMEQSLPSDYLCKFFQIFFFFNYPSQHTVKDCASFTNYMRRRMRSMEALLSLLWPCGCLRYVCDQLCMYGGHSIPTWTRRESHWWSVLDFWKINLEKSCSTNWIFSLFRTGFLLPNAYVACKNQFQNWFLLAKNPVHRTWFLQLDFSTGGAGG